MSSDDSNEFENFCAEQKSKVKKRYMTRRELEQLDTMDDFIVDSESDCGNSSSEENEEESERSKLSDDESDEMSKSFDVKVSDHKINKRKRSSSLFSNLSDSNTDEKGDKTNSENLKSKKRLIRYESESSLDDNDSKKKCCNDFAYKGATVKNLYQQCLITNGNSNNFSDKSKFYIISKYEKNFSKILGIQCDFNNYLYSQTGHPMSQKYIKINCNYDYDTISNMNIAIPIVNNNIDFTDMFGNPHLQKLDFISSLLNEVVNEMKDLEAVNFIKSYRTTKEELSRKIFQICNECIFSNNLPQDNNIMWFSTLNKTAGRCVLSCDEKNPLVHLIKIELSAKILTDPERLLKTLVHEMCHAAVWIINKQNGHHGPLWKAWTQEVQRVFPLLSVSSRYHSYDSMEKYEYPILTSNEEIIDDDVFTKRGYQRDNWCVVSQISVDNGRYCALSECQIIGERKSVPDNIEGISRFVNYELVVSL